jgi:Tfp pilus assembly protein PilX
MRRNERGLALVTSILALMVLTGLAVGLVYMTSAETMINDNYKNSQQAYDAALAGLQNVRERMTPAAAGAHAILPSLPTAMPGSGGNTILYVTNPQAAEAINSNTITANGSAYYDKEICSELVAQGITTPAACAPLANTTTIAEDPASLNTLNYKWVRVILKANAGAFPYFTNNNSASSTAVNQTQVCWDGSQQVLLGGAITACSNDPASVYTPVYQLTSLSLTPTNSTRMVQMEVALDPPLNTRGAVDSQDHVTLNGQLDVNGYDYCQCDCVTDKNGNTTCTNRTTGAQCTAANSNYAIYASNTVDNPNTSETFVSGKTPPVVQNQPWPYDLQSIVSQYTNAPGTVFATGSPYNWSCSGTPPSCGTQPNGNFGIPPNFPPSPPSNPAGPGNMFSQVTYVPGDVTLTANATGNGVLIVNGNLDIHGGLDFYGLIIVTGVVSFTGGGSNKVNIYGGIIAGQQSVVDNVVGGGANIMFDRCALPQRNNNQPPRVLAMRELVF